MFSVSRVDVFQKWTATGDPRRVLGSNFLSGSGQNPTFLRSHQKKFPFRAFGVACPNGTSEKQEKSAGVGGVRVPIRKRLDSYATCPFHPCPKRTRRQTSLLVSRWRFALACVIHELYLG
jgi:hypothetical protein